MSEEKRKMTVGDLKEAFRAVKLPKKDTVHFISMCMGIPTWGLLGHINPILGLIGIIVQGLGLTIMLANMALRKD